MPMAYGMPSDLPLASANNIKAEQEAVCPFRDGAVKTDYPTRPNDEQQGNALAVQKSSKSGWNRSGK